MQSSGRASFVRPTARKRNTHGAAVRGGACVRGRLPARASRDEPRMEDIAASVISQLRLDDLASPLELRVAGIDYANPDYIFHTPKHCAVLKAAAPIEAGRLVVKIAYLDNHDTTRDSGYSPPRYRHGWQSLTYERADWEGAAAFVDGFMRSGGRADRLALHERDSTRELAAWHTARVGNPTAEGDAARVALFRGAVKALLAQAGA